MWVIKVYLIFVLFSNVCFSLLIFPQNFLQYIAIVVVNTIVDPWLLLPAAVMTLLFYLMRIVYVNTGRCFKRIEAKSWLIPNLVFFLFSYEFSRYIFRSKSNIFACKCDSSRFVYDPCVQSGKIAKK